MVLVQCKICLEEYPTREIEAEDLISPCACKESVKYVHRKCLTRWHQEAGVVHDRCTICNTKYEYEDTITTTSVLSKKELEAIVCLGCCFVAYFVSVFFMVHSIREDERYIWYLNTSRSSCIAWEIGMLIADGFVTIGFLVGVLSFLVSLGHFNPVFTLNGKGDALDDAHPYNGRSYDGSFCYSIYAFLGVLVACGLVGLLEELYFCLEARRRTNRKIKDLITLNKT